MKLTKSFCGRILMLCLILAALLMSAPRTRADQQGYPSSYVTLTNLPVFLPGYGYVGYPTNYIPMRHTGLGYEVMFVSSNLATANVYSYFYPSIDGTNAGGQGVTLASSTPFAVLATPGNGTNLSCGYTNWSRQQLEGITGFFVCVSNSQTTSVYMSTNLYLATTNSFIPTNIVGGVYAFRPNQ